MENFLGIKYEGKNKLTHKEMMYYLYEKNKPIPEPVSFSKLKKEPILKGHYLIVKDETNRVIPYYNLRRVEDLLPELQADQRHNDFSKRRARTLSKKQNSNTISISSSTK